MDSGKSIGKHPIKVVARRTGLTPDVIRVWERRYHAVEPERSSGSRRLYSDEQVERLRLLRLATLAGRRISELAPLGTEELEQIVQNDQTAASAAAALTPARPPVQEGHIQDACMQAVRDLDARSLTQALAQGTVELSPHQFIEQLLLPFLRWVGESWRSGDIRASHEHMATSIVRSFVHTMHSDRDVAPGAPEIVLATPTGQRHEMGALFASVTASTEGWRVTYLGTSLPAEDIAAAVTQRQATVLALSLVYPVDDPELPAELKRLRQLAGRDFEILAGGRATARYRPALDSIGAHVCDDLDRFRLELERIRYGA